MANSAKPKFDKQAWQEETELRTKELTDKLEVGIKDLFSSDKYKEYLKSMSHFHNYSSRNVMLIHSQMPKATRVASFKLWKEKFNRSPKRGETSLRIFAPIEVKPKTEMFEKIDPATGKAFLDDNGKPVMEELTELPKRNIAFKLVPVFDVSQTVGEPLPKLAEDLTGNVEHYEAFLDTLKAISPVPIVFEPMDENQDGYCQYGVKIGIREGMSEIQTVSAIIHEITHARLHDREKVAEGEKPTSKDVKEIEAESVSYVVCQKYGIETGANSFGYLATWSTHDLNDFKASQDTIRKEANILINAIDDRFKAICKERGIDLTAPAEQAAEMPPTQAAEAPAEPTFTTETTTENIAGVDFTVSEVVPTVPKTLEQQNFEKLAELFPQIASGEFYYQRSEAGAGFMPLSLEWIDTDKLSIMHTYTQNSDLMYDPMIVLQVDQEAKTATAVEFQQSMPPLYQRIEDGVGHSIDGNGNERTINGLQGKINDFTAQWLVNIDNQDFAPVTAVLRDEEYSDPTVYFNADKKPFSLAFMYDSEGTTIMNNLDRDDNKNLVKVAHVDSFRNVTFFEENLPKDVVTIVENVKLTNEQTKQPEVAEQAPEYHIGSGPAENGVEVWNWNETEDKDGQPKFLATINFDREITYLDDTLPEEVKAEIVGISQANWKEVYAIEMAGMDYDPPPPPWERDPMPDPSITPAERDAYGYTAEDILPLNKERALELFNNDHAVFMLYPDNEEAMVFEVLEIEAHDGIFGIEREEWQKTAEYKAMDNKTDQQQTTPAVEQGGGNEPPPTEPPAVEIPEIPRKDQPIYKLSADDALKNGEIQAFHDSRKLNVECGNAIDKAVIASNYEEHRYDLNTAIRGVIEEHGADRVAWVLASAVNDQSYDGRLSSASKDWAKEFDTPKPDVYLKSHMILIEGLVEKFCKVEKEKPSLMSALDAGEKKSKTEFDGKAQPGLDAPDKTKKKGMEV